MRARQVALFIALVATTHTLIGAAGEKRAIRPEDLVDIRGVSDAQISPDGKRVAFVVTEPADPKKPQQARDSNIWIVPADGSEPPRIFAATPKKETQPHWSPDGRYLAFLSDRGQPVGEEKEAKPQLYLMRTDGGEAEQLTSLKGEVLALKWSPDGKMIAFTVRDPKSDGDQKKEKEGFDEVHVDHDYKYARLWIVSLAERKPDQITKQDFEVNDIAWAPDGSELALRVSATPRKDDVYWHSKLVVVRRLTGETTRTLTETAADISGSLRWSPDGKHITTGLFTPNRISAWLSLIPAEGGPARQLLKEYRGTVWGIEWTPDSRSLIAQSIEGTQAMLISIDTISGAVAKLADSQNFTVSADGRTIAYLQQPAESPGDIWVMTIGQAPRRVTDMHTQVAAWRLGAMREVTWKNKKDGITLYGILITPPDFKAGQTYPTVVQVHGGPMWAWPLAWHGSWHDWGHYLASHGYVVFLPNPRGSTGQGWQFAEANRDDWGGGDFQDIMSGVDYLVEQKIADPDRLGIGGWSYGGFMTSWSVTQTHRFKAAVVGAAVTNLFSFNGTTDITPSFLRNYFVDLPFRRRAAYDNHSAMTFLQNCKTPSLVIHGDSDERVPVTQGWEIYNGLRMLGIEAEMVVYPREHHGISERPHQLDLLRRVLAWYDKYLKN
jgi:dipeptidyl aminopeptidase/acylaminoacyl peptidase